eukprot:g5999.t1
MEIEKKEESRKNVFKRVYEWTLKKFGHDETSRRIIKFFFVTLCSRLLCFWIPNALLHVFVYKLGFLKQYKIQSRMPTPALVKEAFFSNLVTDIVGTPLLAVAMLKLLDLGRSAGVSSTGWSKLRFEGKSPSKWTIIWQVLVAYFGYDFMFYFSHRWLHQKSVYLRFHKQHHRFTKTIGLASSYQGSLEGAIQLLNWYVPIGVAGALNGDLHWKTLFAYNCFRWIETVDAHCGYDFPFSPFSFIPIFGGAKAHDLHHSGEGLQMVKMKDGTLFADFGNYGASVIWDWLLGTQSPGMVE